MKIFKYAIPVYNKEYSLSLPEGSKVLSCQNQNNQIVIWVMFNPSTSQGLKTHKFKLIFTGEDFQLSLDLAEHRLFIGTVQINEMVHHLFLDEIV